MKQASAAAGIDFTGKCDRYPNSLSTHALLKYAKINSPEKQNQLQEILFRKYFTDGLYSTGENLEAAANEAGLDGSLARQYAEDPANKDAARQEARANSSRGISGVPYFIINGRHVGSGAQPPEYFAELFEAV
jgi:predicted DsbA family dithiol-disulfide isomerase